MPCNARAPYERLRVMKRLAVLLVVLAGCSTASPVRQVATAVRGPSVVQGPSAVAPASPIAQLPVVPAGCSPRAEACVSRAHRVAWLQHDGRVTYGPVPVALGRASQPTPRGRFAVAWKDAEHTSSSYGIDMPFSVFFAAGGIAFHEGPLDEPSHGCVHLGRAAAEAFFGALAPGDRVQVL